MNFNYVGIIKLPAETDKFKPYSESDYSSGWSGKRLKFNISCGDNSHLLSVNGLYKKDGSNDLFLFSKAEDGEEKGESYSVKFKDRKEKKYIDKCAEWRKYVLDLEYPRKRMLLRNAVEEGKEISAEDKTKYSIGENIKEEYSKSLARKYEFLSEIDFIDYLVKIMKSGKYDNEKFRVRGAGEYAYNGEKQVIYENLIPRRIYLCEKDEEFKSECNIKMLVSEDSLDMENFDETGRIYINGHIVERDTGSMKAEFLPVEKTVVIDLNDDDKKDLKAKYIKSRYTIKGNEVKETMFNCNMLDGAQRIAISYEDLNDDQKFLIDSGFETLEGIAKDLGNEVYSDRIRELRFISFGNGYKTADKDTSYDKDDIHVRFKEVEDVNPFGDDDIDLDI